MTCYFAVQGRVANARPVATIKTGRVAQPITDASDAIGLNCGDRSCICNAPLVCTYNVHVAQQCDFRFDLFFSFSFSFPVNF